jgi:hypothetical protein
MNGSQLTLNQVTYTLTDGAARTAQRFTDPVEAAQAFYATDARLRPGVIRTNERGAASAIADTSAVGIGASAKYGKSVGGVLDQAFKQAYEQLVKRGQTVRTLKEAIKPELAKPAISVENKTIGASLPKGEWEIARGKVGGKDGRVFLPRENREYTGQVLYATETHLIQQVGKHAAVAHDLTKLENNKELMEQYDKGQLSNKVVKLQYGEDKGRAEVVSVSVQRANEIKKQAGEWAEKNITNQKSREIFVQHIESFTRDLSKANYQTTKPPLAPPKPIEQTPARDRGR